MKAKSTHTNAGGKLMLLYILFYRENKLVPFLRVFQKQFIQNVSRDIYFTLLSIELKLKAAEHVLLRTGQLCG